MWKNRRRKRFEDGRYSGAESGQLNTLFIICCCSITMSLLVSVSFWSSSLPGTWPATTGIASCGLLALHSLLLHTCFFFFSSSSFDNFFLRSLAVFWSFSMISFILLTCFLLCPTCFSPLCLALFDLHRHLTRLNGNLR